MLTNFVKNRSFLTASIGNIAEAIGYDVDDIMFYVAQANNRLRVSVEAETLEIAMRLTAAAVAGGYHIDEAAYAALSALEDDGFLDYVLCLKDELEEEGFMDTEIFDIYVSEF